MQNERKEYVDALENEQYLIDLNKERLRLMTALSAISDEKNAKIEPTYEFEKDEEWVRLHSEFLKLESKAKRREVENDTKNREKRVGLINDELARFDEAIPKAEQELAKRTE